MPGLYPIENQRLDSVVRRTGRFCAPSKPAILSRASEARGANAAVQETAREGRGEIPSVLRSTADTVGTDGSRRRRSGRSVVEQFLAADRFIQPTRIVYSSCAAVAF